MSEKDQNNIIQSSDFDGISKPKNPDITFEDKFNKLLITHGTLQEELSQVKNDLQKTKNEFEKSRFDLITLLGLFVALITYLGLEIQVFKVLHNPLLVIGVSIFFIASILLFILALNLIIKKSDDIKWKDINNPIYYILTFLLLLSIGFIVEGDKTNNTTVDSKRLGISMLSCDDS